MDILEALSVDGGLVAAVGAGGKKSVLHAIAAAWPAGRGRLLMTATARCTPPPAGLLATVEGGDGQDLGRVLAGHPGARVFAAGPMRKPGRHEGLAAGAVPALHADGGFALTLVKADGARMRWVKAPAADEPALPPGVDLLLPVLSLRALGRPLDERSAHRPERIAALTGRPLGDPLTEADYVALLTHPEAALKSAGEARVVPVLNMAGDAASRAAGERIARAALATSGRIDRILVARLRDPARPWLAVVAR